MMKKKLNVCLRKIEPGMPYIELYTKIDAPIDICFDLARSIDLHKVSTQQTREEAVAGVTTGLISLGETVTWRAQHFGVWQELTSQITEFDRPTFFADEMLKGAFAGFRHEHHFKSLDSVTEMTDYFDFRSPLGVLGHLVNRLVLTRYMTNLLKVRNRVIKEVAESGKWQTILDRAGNGSEDFAIS